jgi:nucleoside-diphosphate-sugar epimerase
MAEHVTVFGASGLLGARLTARLVQTGASVTSITRNNWPKAGTALGHAIYAIGVTGDFRTRAHDAMEAHVGALSRALRDYRFESFTYMSSSRLYRCSDTADEQTARFTLSPADSDKLYDISKLAGEALCLAVPQQRTHIVRMSNAFAPGDTSPNFLPSVLREAASTGKVTIRQSAASRKDYIALDDAASAIIAIAQRGSHDIYNVASGVLTTHGEIAARLAALRGWRIAFAEAGPDDLQPHLDTARLAALVAWRPRRLLDDLPALCDAADHLWGRVA